MGFEVSNYPAAWKLDYSVTFELLMSDSKKYLNWSQKFVPNFFLASEGSTYVGRVCCNSGTENVGKRKPFTHKNLVVMVVEHLTESYIAQ